MCVWDCVTVGVSDDSSRDMHMHNIAGLCSLQSPFGSMLFQNFNFVFVFIISPKRTWGKGIKASTGAPRDLPHLGFLFFVRDFVFYLPAGLQALRLLYDSLCELLLVSCIVVIFIVVVADVVVYRLV